VEIPVVIAILIIVIMAGRLSLLLSIARSLESAACIFNLHFEKAKTFLHFIKTERNNGMEMAMPMEIEMEMEWCSRGIS